MENARKYAAEAIGTFWLTFGGCGSAVIAAGFPQVGIGLVGVSLAFGLTVLTMAYAIGHISGCHLNPAVTVGLAAGGRFPPGQIIPYVLAQVVGAVAASALLYVIASGASGFDLAKGFAANGYAEHSPGHYSLLSAMVTELVMTMMFLFIIMGATTAGRRPGLPARDRAGADTDPSCEHSGHQHVRQSGAQHRTSALRRRMGAQPALVVLGCTADWRCARRNPVPLDQHRTVRPGGRRSNSGAPAVRRTHASPAARSRAAYASVP